MPKFLARQQTELQEWCSLAAEDNTLLPELEGMIATWELHVQQWQRGQRPAPVAARKESVMVELSAGGGGDEAQDWSQTVLQMLLGYCQQHHLRTEILDVATTNTGIRKALFKANGIDAQTLLGPEAGVHRLSRISPYGKGGRRQTSFCRVEILPVITDRQQPLPNGEIDIQVSRSSGPGGQHRNKVETAVKATHIPTGIHVQISNSRSQLANKQDALAILQVRVHEYQRQQRQASADGQRGQWAQNSDSAGAAFGHRRRSYVVHPQQLVHDHLSGRKSSQLNRVLAGELDLVR